MVRPVRTSSRLCLCGFSLYLFSDSLREKLAIAVLLWSNSQLHTCTLGSHSTWRYTVWSASSTADGWCWGLCSRAPQGGDNKVEAKIEGEKVSSITPCMQKQELVVKETVKKHVVCSSSTNSPLFRVYLRSSPLLYQTTTAILSYIGFYYEAAKSENVGFSSAET